MREDIAQWLGSVVHQFSHDRVAAAADAFSNITDTTETGVWAVHLPPPTATGIRNHCRQENERQRDYRVHNFVHGMVPNPDERQKNNSSQQDH